MHAQWTVCWVTTYLSRLALVPPVGLRTKKPRETVFPLLLRLAAGDWWWRWRQCSTRHTHSNTIAQSSHFLHSPCYVLMFSPSDMSQNGTNIWSLESNHLHLLCRDSGCWSYGSHTNVNIVLGVKHCPPGTTILTNLHYVLNLTYLIYHISTNTYQNKVFM